MCSFHQIDTHTRTGFINGQHQHTSRPHLQPSYGKIRGTHTPSPLSAVFKAAALQTTLPNRARLCELPLPLSESSSSSPSTYLTWLTDIQSPLRLPLSPLSFMPLLLPLNIGGNAESPYRINPSNIRLSKVDWGRKLYVNQNLYLLMLAVSPSNTPSL